MWLECHFKCQVNKSFNFVLKVSLLEWVSNPQVFSGSFRPQVTHQPKVRVGPLLQTVKVKGEVVVPVSTRIFSTYSLVLSSSRISPHHYTPLLPETFGIGVVPLLNPGLLDVEPLQQLRWSKPSTLESLHFLPMIG